MLQSKAFQDKKILVLDKALKNQNDRTWCFWEAGKGFFEPIVFRKWDSIAFKSPDYSASMELQPYQYKMIRGVDFYQYCFSQLQQASNVEIVYGEINDWSVSNDVIQLQMNSQTFQLKNTDTTIFNSIYKPDLAQQGTIKLLQHFKGWVIETDKPVFKTDEATMMDFRVHQQHGTTFAYVLPFSTTSALVEYTLFTKEVLTEQQYTEELKNYINDFLKIEQYKVVEEEYGVIPMTNEKFSFSGKGWQIGTAGGQTKASSGYTFQFIQKQSEAILACLLNGKPLHQIPPTPQRFRFYDNTLLHILFYNKVPGAFIFSRLFKRNQPQQVLKFLDNETSLKEELKIIGSLPVWPFLKAALHQL